MVEDTQTNILYLCSDNELDLCVFLNPEGKPYTKDNFLNEYDRLKEK